MESIYTPVIIENILGYLDKNSIFNFIYLCNDLSDFSYYIYNKYKFDYNLTKNTSNINKIKYLNNVDENDIPKIKTIYLNIKGFYGVKYSPLIDLHIEYKKMIHIMVINNDPPNLKQYSNLKKVTIDYELFNKKLDFLPESIEEINIDSMMFNQPIKNVLPNLKKLSIESLSFNSKISNDLISKLGSVNIHSPTYTQTPNLSNSEISRFFSLMHGITGLRYSN